MLKIIKMLYCWIVIGHSPLAKDGKRSCFRCGFKLKMRPQIKGLSIKGHRHWINDPEIINSLGIKRKHSVIENRCSNGYEAFLMDSVLPHKIGGGTIAEVSEDEEVKNAIRFGP